MASAVDQRFREQLETLGKVALNSKYPNDFEVYMMSLELTDSEDNSQQFLAFPVMPNQITKTEPKRVNLKRSASGVTVIMSEAMIPNEISIKGDFGRSFKLMLQPGNGGTAEGFGFTGFNPSAKNLAFNTPSFDGAIKTGFGVIKIMQSMIDQSMTLDSRGKPHRLYLYNMALSESYLVSITPQGLSLTQDLAKNMIWSYSITFSVLCPLDKIRTMDNKTSSKKLLEVSLVQGFANAAASNLKSVI